MRGVFFAGGVILARYTAAFQTDCCGHPGVLLFVPEPGVGAGWRKGGGGRGGRLIAEAEQTSHASGLLSLRQKATFRRAARMHSGRDGITFFSSFFSSFSFFKLYYLHFYIDTYRHIFPT